MLENMEERYWVTNALEVWVDVQPTAKLVPLFSGSCLFLKDYCTKYLCERFLCSMEVICRLHSYRRGGAAYKTFYAGR